MEQRKKEKDSYLLRSKIKYLDLDYLKIPSLYPFMLYLSSLAKISFEEKGRRYRYGTLLSLRISVDRERIGRQRGMVVFFNSVNIVERWSTINSTR